MTSACKYMMAEGGLRFLRNWSLRLTPPADFNDPFELRPPSDRIFTEAYVDLEFQNAAPQMAIDNLTELLTSHLGNHLSREEIAELATCMVTPVYAQSQDRILKKLSHKIPSFSRTVFLRLQKQIQEQWPAMMQQAKVAAATVIPNFNSIAKLGFTETLPGILGVLCLSRNANQALMWAHYADSHKGMMFEFDAAHSTFNRKRSTDDDLGYLRAVTYSQNRPELTMAVIDGDNAFEVFALTKADQWSYEEEVRFLWPLKLADQQVETKAGPIALLKCPSSAVVSITLGCKCSEESLREVHHTLLNSPDTAHIVVRKAELDENEFKLNYRTLWPTN